MKFFLTRVIHKFLNLLTFLPTKNVDRLSHLLRFCTPWHSHKFSVGRGEPEAKNHNTENRRSQLLAFAFTEIYMKKLSDRNSAASAVAGFAGIIEDAILPTAGVELRSDKEYLIWSQFTCARAKEV